MIKNLLFSSKTILGFSIAIILSTFLMSGFFSSVFAQNEAMFYFSPSSGGYKTNDEFDVELKISTPEPITSFRSYLIFNPNFLSVTELKNNENVFPYWWEQEITPGLVKLQASVPAPGFQGEETVVKLRVKAKRAGMAFLAFGSSPLILTADDKNILSQDALPKARFLVNGLLTTEGYPASLSPLIFPFFVLAALAVGLFLGMWLRSKKRELKR